MLWTVGISPRGEGLTGRGNLFPLPCLQRSTHLASRCRLFCEGYPYTSAGSPHPTCAFGRRIPGYLAGTPHPARAFGAPPPPPSGGRGPCVAISGEQPCPGWSRREIVSGVEPVGNRIRLFPTYPLALDRGDIATGGGADGEGELVPPPLSLTLQPPCFSSASPPAPSSAGYPDTSPAAPTPPAPSALLPRPRRGSGVRAWRYLVGSRARGGAGGKSVSGSFPPIPCALDRGAYAIGGGGLRGGGTLPPSPVPCAPQISHISATLLVLLAGIPRPALDDPPVSSRIKRTL